MPFPGEFEFVTPPDPFVVPWPGDLEPITSIFITSRNQPPPPVLATKVFPPPLWPLPPDDQTIMPAVGPIMALTPEQVATPPGFATPFGAEMFGDRDPSRRERHMQREEGREERRDDRRDDREVRAEEREERRSERRRRRNGDRDRVLSGDDPERPAE
jgi:hypothetical protein